MKSPLAGLLVVAIEQAVAAPFCSARLADAGSRVIKIERPEGDFARFYDNAALGGSSYFVTLNRGKESVVLDLRLTENRERLAALIAQADVLVQNLKLGALDRLGWGVTKLRQDHPKLICCSISGYGATGAFASRKAYDLLIQAESGLASVTGGPDGPARVGISVVDISTGATAYAAILEALISRAQSGLGADIQVSMFDVITDWLTVPLLNAEAGQPPQRLGLAHPSIAPYGVFETANGSRILISIQSEREWLVFCRDVLEEPGMITDDRFSSNVMRVNHRAETDAAVAGAFTKLQDEVLIARLSEAEIAFGALNDMTALSRHAQLRRIEVETELGLVSHPTPPVIIARTDRDFGKVPSIGEHTDKVFAEVFGQAMAS